MEYSPISLTLARLRAAADQTNDAWPAMRWDKVAGPGPESLELASSGMFSGLALEPGVDLTLRSQLDLPSRLAGVSLVGDPLELSIFSLYPMDLWWNHQAVFSDDRPPVAAGPALVEVIRALRPGDNGELVARVRVPNNQMTSWFRLRFTTPGLRARFDLLDTLWAELALADALATSIEERKLVERAAELVPQELIAEDGDSLAVALRRMEDCLAPLSAPAAGLTVHVIGHSHIDMNWLWTWPDTVEVIRRDFKSVLSLMDDYPEMTFTHSQPATYEVIRQLEPALFARVLEQIRRGRWEPATMTWVEGDGNMASGEATARQLLEGVTFSREVLGARPSTFLAPDTFGHAGNLPQLAASAGAARYYHHRCNPGQADQWPAYWWEGQDGTRILAISTSTYNGAIRARDLAEAAMHARRHGLSASLHFHGIGDHGGGPARHNLDALRRFQQRPLLPTARCSTLDAYARAILDSGAVLPTRRGESSTIFEGCYTTHADTKRYNRHGENLLCTADTLAALAGQDPGDELREAWRTVLFNQFHDILDGSAIHEAYEKNAEDFVAVVATARATVDGALSVLERGIEPGHIAVTNPLGWEREDWVEVPVPIERDAVWLIGDQGHRTVGQRTADGLGFVARVPAFGTVSYRVQPDGGPDPLAAVPEPNPSQESEALRAEPCYAPTDARRASMLSSVADEPPYLRIETAVFRIYLRRDSGILVSFYDKRVGRELIGYGMRRGSDYLDTARADLAFNVLQIADEHPHGMAAWHLDEVHAETSLLRGAATRVIEAGPARLVVEVCHQVRQSSVVQRIIFYRDLARVDLQTALDWQEIGGAQAGIPNLKVAFTAHLPECEAWFETPFAAVRRPSDGQEVPALRWADVGGDEYGIALLNDSKYGYDALGTRLRLTLVRGAYSPDAISDVGQHSVVYSLVPHPGSWRDAGIPRLATGLNQPLLAREVAADAPASRGENGTTWRPIAVGAPSVLIACLKMSHDRTGRVIRLYESAGRAGEAEVRGLPAGARVWETSVVEDCLRELPVQGEAVRLAFGPWQVRTVLVQ
ncbi:MAG: alpha-mannosidase [Chloroflexi bacterium]|nr:alpha-mannosidase [Chloroflexota bacterium]